MEEKLDEKDKKILLALDMNARATDSQIAKKVGLSKQVANYRIKRLEKRQIIESYYPVVDHTKIGLSLYRIWLKLENIDKNKEQEIISFLKKQASWMASTLGTWDIALAVYVNDEYELLNFWNSFFEKFSQHIKDKWISLMTGFWNFERSFILPSGKNRNVTFYVGGRKEKIKLDKTDKQILKELTKNARQTSLAISEKLKETERVVRYRIKRLEKEKIIVGYRPFVNARKLGLNYYKILVNLKNTTTKDVKRIRTHIIQNPNTIYSTEALGGYDFEIEAHFKNSASLFEFFTELKEKFSKNIKSIEHLEYMKEHKISYYF